jgi:hypothetical protein
MAEDHSSHESPTRMSVSGSSGGGSVVAGTPLEVKPEIFQEWFSAAFACNIMQFKHLHDYPPSRILELIVQDPKQGKSRAAEVVHKITGTNIDLILKRWDSKRYGEDISACIEDSPEAAQTFFDAIGGTDFFQEKLTPREIYERVMGLGWMFEDNPRHRGFAAQGCIILVKHRAFGDVMSEAHGQVIESDIPTLRAIVKAIEFDVLVGEDVPRPLVARMFRAVKKGCREYPKTSQYIEQYLFEEQLGGVPFTELALKSKIPLDKLANPFAVYVDRCGLIRTDADKPSEIPGPPADPPKQDERTSAFVMPRLVPPPLPTRQDNKPPGST